jgi:hypothetical protein
MSKRKFEEDVSSDVEKVAKRAALEVADSKTAAIVEEVKQIVVSAVVEEVNQSGCVCGPWSLRISRTPKVPPPATSEVLPKGVSMTPALGEPAVV